MADDTRFRSTFPLPHEGSQGFRTSAWHGVAVRPGDAPSLLSSSWSSALAKAAKEGSRAGVTYIDAEGQELTQSYASIEAKATAVALGLQERGVQPGDAVMVLVESPLEFAAVLFGLARLSAVPILVEPPRADHGEDAAIAELADAADRSGASFLVASKALRSKLVRLGARVPALARVTTSEALLESSVTSSAVAALPPPGGPQETLYVQYAHEGGPHGIELTQRSVLGNVHALGQAAQVNRNDRVLTVAPPHRDLGLVGGLLFSVYWCVPLTVLSPRDVLAEPIRLLRTVAERRISIAALGAALCDAATQLPNERDLPDLSSWRLAPCLGDAAEVAAALQFAARFAAAGFRADALWPVYGVTEASLVVAAPEPGQPVETQRVDANALARGRVQAAGGGPAIALPCVGRAVFGHRILVVDAEGDELDDGHIGHVVVTGPSLMRGYWNEPEPTGFVLQEGWLWPGDLGFMRAGKLTLSGRARNVLAHAGKNHHVVDLEREVEAAFGAGSKAAVFVVAEIVDPASASDAGGRLDEVERVVAVVETRNDDESRAARAQALVKERFGIQLADVVRVPVGRLSRNSAGAVQRVRTRERLLDGSLLEREGLGSMASRWVRRLMR